MKRYKYVNIKWSDLQLDLKPAIKNATEVTLRLSNVIFLIKYY